MRLNSLLLMAAFAATASAQELTTAQAVLDCAARNAPEQSFTQAAELLVRDGGQNEGRQIVARFAGQRAKNGLVLNVLVSEPVDVAGSAVLLRQADDGRDDVKLYLPALRRVRSVTGSMAGQDLLGTDFSYSDIKQVYGAFNDAEAELLEPGMWQERATYRLLMRPAPEQESPYARLLIDFDQLSCAPVVISFESAQNEALKRLEGDALSLYSLGERQLIGRYTMFDLVDNTSTVLMLGPAEFDTEISRVAFHPSTFYDYNNRAKLPQN